jgi:hypothetical protein
VLPPFSIELCFEVFFTEFRFLSLEIEDDDDVLSGVTELTSRTRVLDFDVEDNPNDLT